MESPTEVNHLRLAAYTCRACAEQFLAKGPNCPASGIRTCGLCGQMTVCWISMGYAFPFGEPVLKGKSKAQWFRQPDGSCEANILYHHLQAAPNGMWRIHGIKAGIPTIVARGTNETMSGAMWEAETESIKQLFKPV